MKIRLFTLFVVFAAFFSCKKEPVNPAPVPKPKLVNLLDSINAKNEFDAPFVYLDGDSVRLKRIMKVEGREDLKVKAFALNKKEDMEFTVFINHINPKYKDFKVKVNRDMPKVKSSEWTTDGQIFALSDFEGEFFHFVDLLVGAGVIDANYNWTYGNNHLIFLGDIFDRGTMVHECLWLLYKLEAEGANIHFIHGNHDIMNISGNQTNYIAEKYFKNFKALGFSKIQDFYKEHTILGSWLRNQHVIEKGNGILFVHGGLSYKLLKKYPNLNIEEMNKLVQRNFDTPKSEEAKSFLSGSSSLIWYRGYFKSPKESQQDLEKVLKHFDARLTCVAHTLQNQAGLSYEGKVACTDVNVHKGQKEALIFDKDKIYRIEVQENGNTVRHLL